MENKYEQLASTQQNEHQVKEFKRKQQLKKGVQWNDNKNNLHAYGICKRDNRRNHRKRAAKTFKL